MMAALIVRQWKAVRYSARARSACESRCSDAAYGPFPPGTRRTLSIPARSTPQFLRRGLSIEHKLPLAFCALLVLLLAIYVWLAYHEVETSSRIATSERLSRAGAELAGAVTRGVTARQATFERVTARPALRAALDGVQSVAAESALATLRVGSERPSPAILLLDPAQRVVARFGDTLSVGAQRRLPRALRDAAERERSVVNSELFADRDRAFFWSTYAIRDSARQRGYIAQLRSVGSPTAPNPISGLIGDQTAVIFANRNDLDGPWVRLEGTVMTRPDVVHATGPTHTHVRAGASFLAESVPIAGTPWVVVLETPEQLTRARASAFLRRTGLLGLGLILVGMLIVWLVSRRFTRPMRELAAAADGIAAGDYDQRVGTGRTDELGALALAFNHMASEVQRSVSETEASRAEAEMANRVKSEFLANMSHEIRTPINAMLGYADLMDLGIGGPITEEQRRQLERIRVNGRHLTSLIDDLLDFARAETGRLSVRVALALATDAVRTALTVLAPEAIAKSVELSVQCSDDISYLGDSQRVEQILVNLLGNAIKFTPTGGRVTLTCESDQFAGEHRTTFAVDDTGVGIEPDRLEFIFEAFVQGDSGYTRPHGGSGLGLTISRRLAHLMGGEIEVSSTVGVGSRFTLVLPAPAPTLARAFHDAPSDLEDNQTSETRTV